MIAEDPSFFLLLLLLGPVFITWKYRAVKCFIIINKLTTVNRVFFFLLKLNRLNRYSNSLTPKLSSKQAPVQPLALQWMEALSRNDFALSSKTQNLPIIRCHLIYFDSWCINGIVRTCQKWSPPSKLTCKASRVFLNCVVMENDLSSLS